MLALFWILVSAQAAGQVGARSPAIDFGAMESELLLALNGLRADPKSLIPQLEHQRQHFDGKLLKLPGEIALATFEGPAAVDEAIAFSRSADALGPLNRSEGMSRAAADHVRDLGKTGATSHTGSDGSDPSVRLRRHGAWKKTAGENIAFGPPSGGRMVLQLLIDDGVPGREHRKNFFKPGFARVGVACGPHPSLRTVCVIDFAGDYQEGRPANARP